MPAYSILTTDGDRARRSAAEGDGPAVLKYRRPDALLPAASPLAAAMAHRVDDARVEMLAAGEQPPRTARAGDAESTEHDDPATPWLPKVILQLPNVTAAESARTDARFPFASQIYWAAIVLGALVALALIWTGKKTTVRQMDEAPRWSADRSALRIDGASAAAEQVTESTSVPAPRATITAVTVCPAMPSGVAMPAPIMPDVPCLEPSRQEPAVQAHDGPALNDPANPSSPDTSASGAEAAQPPLVGATSNPNGRWDGGANRLRPSEAAPLGISTPVSP